MTGSFQRTNWGKHPLREDRLPHPCGVNAAQQVFVTAVGRFFPIPHHPHRVKAPGVPSGYGSHDTRPASSV
jgi:hypothetical protein